MLEAIYYGSPVLLQNILVSAYGYKLYRKRYSGLRYSKLLEKVRECRTWSLAETKAYQSEQLHRMVKHCRASIPYYQQLFANYGLHENNVTETEHITRLPILTKDTLRAYPDLFKQPKIPPFMLQHTSGSTGTPLTLMVNEETYKLAMALLVGHEELHGVAFGAKRATFAGRMIQPATDMTPPFWRKNRAENQQLFSSYHLNSRTFPWYRLELDRFQPSEIIGYPSAICDLALQYREAGVAPAFRPTVIVTNSETLLDWQRSIIESVFGCPIADYYGTAEYVLFAGQDKDQIYYLNPLIGLTELVEQPDSQNSGRLIATSLTNASMPLLRYDIGDTAACLPSGRSGSLVTRLTEIRGRVDDYITTPDGRRIGRIDHIFKGIRGILEAQVIQDESDHCTIKLVPSSTYVPKSEITTISENFSARTGGKLRLDIDIVKSIPRGPNGKFKGVAREITKG